MVIFMRVAFYESDITPPLGCYMWGYYKKRLADDVSEKLYSKAFVAELCGTAIAVVSVDCCVLPREMHDIVCRRIEEYTGISPENVVITANHTHRGAPVFSSPELNLYADEAYTDVFYRLVADSVILAYKRLSEAELSFVKTDLEGIAFNRDGLFDDGKLHTHVRNIHTVKILGKTDPELGILKVTKDGKPIGAIINYALHQDTAGGLAYTGDYSSVLSEKLKEEYGSDFVSLFVIGTAGDINHVNNDINIPLPENYENGFHRTVGKMLADKVKSVFDCGEAVVGGISSIKEKITFKKRVIDKNTPEMFEKELDKMLKDGIRGLRIRNFVYYFSANESDREDLYVQTIRIGDLAIYALPGEMFAEYGLKIKECSPASKNIVIELCNNYCGYIPSKAAFADNSVMYETSLCFHSCMEPSTGEKIVTKALEQAEKLFKNK